MPEIVLHVQQVSKTYPNSEGPLPLTVLDQISFEVEAGSSIAMMGPSGSGKTTLLGLCAGLDIPSAGRISLLGVALHDLSEDERAQIRNQSVGFVFQNFQLLASLTALENVMVPAELRGERQARRMAEEWLQRVGLATRMHHYPSQLSGGEQQRVALARAFVNAPRILFADEPTGNLDAENAALITELMFRINQELGTTLVLVTHNEELARETGRIFYLRSGRIVDEKPGRL